MFEELAHFCGVTVASWIIYVANSVASGRKINSLSGNTLTKIIIFWYMTPPESVLHVLALVAPRPAPLLTNRALTCKMTVSSLVIQITIICFKIKNPPPVELCWQKKRNP
jgi:hypothetical protein